MHSYFKYAQLTWNKNFKIKKDVLENPRNGRNLMFLAKIGFEVYGIDISSYAVKIIKKLSKKENLKINARVGNIFKKLPYKNEFFDVVIYTRTLNHGKINWIRKTIKEIYRVLKPSGYVFITVHKHRGKKHIPKERLYGIKWIEPRTYIILGGPEKGIIHYKFNKEILIKEFKKVGFRILKF